MSERTAKQIALHTIAAISGCALLAYLIWRVGPANLLRNISTLGWGLALIIALGGIVHLVKIWAWRLTLPDFSGRVSFPLLLQLRLASEAVGQLGVLGQVFGEGLRVSALGSKIPIDSRIASVTIDRVMFISSGALVILVGTSTALLAMPLSPVVRHSAILFIVALFGLLSAVALAMLNRWPFVSASARFFGQLRFLRNKVKGALPLIHSVEKKLLDFHHQNPRAFWASLFLNLACHGFAVLEVYLILWLMGFKIGFLGALVFEVLGKLVNAVGAVNPGNVGTYEGGNVVIAKLLGLSGAVGLSVAVARRLRVIFWTAVGGFCLFLLPRSRAHGDSDRSRSGIIPANSTSEMKDRRGGLSITSVILANSFQVSGQVVSPLLRVGMLPILLRVILSVHRAIEGRIIVCVDPLAKRDIMREVLSSGRLPYSVDWLEARPDMPLTHLLRKITFVSGDDHLMLVAGNSSYHPAVFRQAMDRNGKNDALVLTTGGRPVGICVFPAGIALDAVEHCPAEACRLDQLHAWLIASHSVDCEPIDEGQWQTVLTEEDCVAAERKLDRWLVKPTDGFFAKMNRKISVPISRKLILFPITPNMVSIFTLGVGIVSGLFFALGGYWNTLLGAILSVWASILDGCDGEVARLKFLESDFGCWLETVCDYLYYLIVFAGMAIGLTRSSGSRMYFTWGIVLLVGAVMSFLVAGFGRLRLAAGRPEQYLRIWQKKAEDLRSNLILYIGRRTEFLVRRCFLPYALLLFAVLNITQVAFFLTAIGANLVWMVSLYSFFNFGSARNSRVADPVISVKTTA